MRTFLENLGVAFPLEPGEVVEKKHWPLMQTFRQNVRAELEKEPDRMKELRSLYYKTASYDTALKTREGLKPVLRAGRVRAACKRLLCATRGLTEMQQRELQARAPG